MNLRDRPPRTIRLRLSAQLIDYLEQLRRTGLYGDTLEDVADNLIRRGLERAVRARMLGLR